MPIWLEDEEDFDGEDLYDFDQITLKKIYNEFTINVTDKDNYEVTTSVKLKYKQDGEKQCYNTIDFKVIYEEDEDAVIELLE